MDRDADWQGALELLIGPPMPAQSGACHGWPRCRARTRTPGRCKASGQGIGGRCLHHGGMHLGAPVGLPRKGRKPARKLVLFSGWFDLLSELFDEPRAKRRWHLMAIPLDLYELLPANTLDGGAESGYVQTLLVARGVARKVARHWPQRLGYRVTLKLAERDRIAFAVMVDRRDLRRAGRLSVRKYNERVRRIGPDKILAALRSAGQCLAPGN